MFFFKKKVGTNRAEKSRFTEFFSSYIFLLILLFVAYVFAFYLAHMTKINEILKEASRHDELYQMGGNIAQTLIAMFMSVVIFKFLLGTKPFQEAIRNIFQDIFIDHDFLSTADRYFLKKLSKNINSADSAIEFIDKHKERESVQKLEDFFWSGKHSYGDKNYIVTSSDYTTTLLSTNIEISHRKIHCKVLKEGEFVFEYKFVPPDKSADIERYTKKPAGNRFTDYSYKELLKTSSNNKAHDIRSEFSTEVKDGYTWIVIRFSKFRAEVDERITIEFSISNKFELSTKEEIEEHYKSTYTYPHAVRNVTFQLENYVDKDKAPQIVPRLIAGDENAKEEYEESIYYKIYSWRIYYSDNQNKEICFKVI